MSFENFYLTNLFKETNEGSSPAEKCSSVRNSLVRLHTESLQKLSNSSTNLLVKQRLADYEESFSENTINNLLGQIDSLLKSKVQTRHCSLWKSNLSSSNIDISSNIKKLLEKSEHCNSDNIACKCDEITNSDISLLLEKKDIKEFQMKSKSDNNVQKVISIPVPSNIVSNLHKTNDKPNEFVTNSNTFQQTNNKGFSYVQPKNIIRPNNNTYQSNNTSKMNTSENNVPRVQQHYNNPVNHDTHGAHNSNSFKTARTELTIQNKKKYGNTYQNNQPENNIVKRSLGTTRSVQSKFIPPLSSGNDETPMQCEEVEDERLKHIDPKMVELIKSEIIDSSAPIGWDDIAGLEFAKTAIQEAVVWPLLRPDIFTGLRRPPKGILLFGPPGTGKTLIGKCIASQCYATFFSISASSLTSKWIGDGEKMVRALFAVARCHQPAVVFIDEIDSLLTQRSDAEHEATRRIKTEFLVQLDGAATGDDDRFLVIGATNRPQELDEAARRRLVKRLYIPLPDIKARQQIVHRLMSTERHSLTLEDMQRVAQLADGFSGADMRSLCSEAALGPIRAVPLSQITNIQCDQVRAVSVEDFKNALGRVRPSVSSNDLEHYIVWDKTYGSGSNLT